MSSIFAGPLRYQIGHCRITLAHGDRVAVKKGCLCSHFSLCCILDPRAYDPSGLRQESRALGATISGMRHRCRCAVSRITRIRLFPLFFHNGCSQSSRFLPQTRRIVGSGDENDCAAKERTWTPSTCNYAIVLFC